MRKHLPVRELVVATVLFAANALAVGYIMGAAPLQATVPIMYETDVQNGCDNGIDDDNDGFTDCGDPDCVGVDPCIAPAPTLGPAGLLAGTVTLLLIGGMALRLRRNEE